MIIEYSYDNNILEFSFEPEDDDILEYNNEGCNTRFIKLNQKKCKFILPDNLSSIHTDLLGLSVVLLIYPFVGSKITLPFPISNEFANHFKKLGKEIGPIDNYLEKRKTIDGNPSLAYSAGTDSSASLLLMPKKTNIIFLDRIIPLGSFTNYNKDNIYRTLDTLIADDYKVLIIKTDLEYIRNPVGFPLDIACSVPNILLADYLNLDSIAYGYCNHHNEFLNNTVDYICTGDNRYYTDVLAEPETSIHYWNELFNICGLKLNMNIMGISEVYTEYIVYKSKYKDIIQSCMRESIGSFCNKCFKCFKRNLIRRILDNNKLNDDDIKEIFTNIENEIKKPRYNKTLESIQEIVKLNTILLFASNFYEGENKIMNNIKTHFSDQTNDFEYILKWNDKSKILMDNKYTNSFLENLDIYK